MRGIVLGLGLALLMTGGCKKDEPAATAEASLDPREEKAKTCERFANEMGRTMALTGMIMVQALEDDPQGAQAQRGRDEIRGKAREMVEDLKAKCMQWPQEVMRCLPPLGVLREGCDERLAAAMDGATPAPKEIAAGPEPAWTFTLDDEPRTLAVSDDGTVLVVASSLDDELLALRDGAIAWRMKGDFARWLLPVPGPEPTWMAARGSEVVAFDPKTGAERFTVALPPDRSEDVEPDPLDEEEDDDLGLDLDELDDLDEVTSIPAATREGDGLLLGDDQARFFRLDPVRCAAAPSSDAPCLTPLGRLPDEILESDAHLFIDGQGRRLLWETGSLRAFDDSWTATMTARPHDTLDEVAVRGDRLVLLIDDDVVDLDPGACVSPTEIAPSGWPQPGAFVFEGSDECPQCRSAWPGCPRWRVYVEAVTGETPALLDDGTVVVHDMEYTLGLRDGAVAWKAITGGGGPLATDGRRIFAFGTGVREGDPPALLELSPADGHPLWSTSLGVEIGESYFSDDIRLVLGPQLLVVSFEKTVVAVPLPAPK